MVLSLRSVTASVKTELLIQKSGNSRVKKSVSISLFRFSNVCYGQLN